MNYYKKKLANEDIDKFLEICNHTNAMIISITCDKDEYVAIYKNHFEITNLDEALELIGDYND